jgi:hypothetical protein
MYVPRFYFHLLNDVDAPDQEGVELPDLNAALEQAVRNARFTAAETLKETGRIVLRHRIDIEDERGHVLQTVHFGDVVKVEQPSGHDEDLRHFGITSHEHTTYEWNGYRYSNAAEAIAAAKRGSR